jgi:hypothetical protein
LTWSPERIDRIGGGHPVATISENADATILSDGRISKEKAPS